MKTEKYLKCRITLNELTKLVKSVKSNIEEDYRAFDDDDAPGIQLTVGYDEETAEWSFQTGDNSYTGSCYFYPRWAVIGVYRDSNCRYLAREIKNQIEELINS